MKKIKSEQPKSKIFGTKFSNSIREKSTDGTESRGIFGITRSLDEHHRSQLLFNLTFAEGL